MIQFKRISTVDHELYQFMESLLQQAFPIEEYRDLTALRDYTDNKSLFNNNVILENGKPIGLITFWNFGDFAYIEHFAIDPNLRNGGYGKSVIESIVSELNIPIVLEVERPIEEMAERRINFYKRQNFELWNNDYQQPPYRIGDDYLPMYLMVNGKLSSDKDYDKVKSKIHKEVYGV